jgi:hypothetical protein
MGARILGPVLALVPEQVLVPELALALVPVPEQVLVPELALALVPVPDNQ